MADLEVEAEQEKGKMGQVTPFQNPDYLDEQQDQPSGLAPAIQTRRSAQRLPQQLATTPRRGIASWLLGPKENPAQPYMRAGCDDMIVMGAIYGTYTKLVGHIYDATMDGIGQIENSAAGWTPGTATAAIAGRLGGNLALELEGGAVEFTQMVRERMRQRCQNQPF